MAAGTRAKNIKTSSSHLCATCSQNVTTNAVQCGRCHLWVHSAQQCSGLPSKLAREILKYDGDCLSYVCISCQTKPSNNSNIDLKQTIDQLYRTVQGISNIVSTLTGRLDNLTDRLENQTQPQLPPIENNSSYPRQNDLKDLIRKEVAEMREREKRKQSIIIRGITYSREDFQTNFNLVTNSIIRRNVTLSNIKPLKPNIVRADIDDADLRRELLLNTSKLKANQLHAHIFISRDLTYTQRSELKERRIGRATLSGANSLPVSGSRTPTSTNSHLGMDSHSATAPATLSPPPSSPPFTNNTTTALSTLCASSPTVFRSEAVMATPPNTRSLQNSPNDQ